MTVICLRPSHYLVRGDDVSLSLASRVYGFVKITLTAKINETLISVSLYIQKEFFTFTFKTGDVDITDDIHWDDIRHPSQELDGAQQLMNYVRIERL